MSGRPREHRVRARDGVEIAVHRLRPASGGGQPVILAAGTFSSRGFWLGARDQGFGFALAREGYEPWIVEFRGHGASARPPTWTLDDWIRFDAPAAMEIVLEETGRERVLWVGHSAGGVVGAAFAGSGIPEAERLAGLVLLGSPGPAGLGPLRRFGAMATLAAAAALPAVHWPGRPLGLGPETEPGRLIRDWMRWNVSGRWFDAFGVDYLERLGDVRVPVLAVAGTGDRILAPPAAVQDLLRRFGSPDRTLIVAGRAHGYTVDFGHPGLVVGRAARAEIWPRLIEWIHGRAGVRSHGPRGGETLS